MSDILATEGFRANVLGPTIGSSETAMSLFCLTQEFEQALALWQGYASSPLRRRGGRRIQAYANTFVEYFVAGTHPLLPLLYFGWAAIGAIARIVNSPTAVLHSLFFCGGVLAFSLAEYLTHRFAFHGRTEDGSVGRRRSFLAHGLHHLVPSDRFRWMVPPMLSFPLGLAFYAIYASALGVRDALIPFGGTCLAYLTYDWTHYSIHRGRKARTGWGRLLRRAHMVHHYSGGEWNYGVTSPLWDVLFGTFAGSTRILPQRGAPRSAVGGAVKLAQR